MTIGIQPTEQGINQALTAMAVSMRSLMQQVQDFQMQVTALGVGGLQTLGYAPADAALVVSQVSYMATIAGVYFGTATQGTDYSFHNQLCPLWAGT